MGLALWIFIFLYFTEPLDVDEFGDKEKLIYLPGYSILGGLSYLFFIPIQTILHKKSNKTWTLFNEFFFLIIFSIVTISFARLYYLFAIVPNEPNPYPLFYMVKAIYLPALITILPIIIIGRYSFGKYKQKKLEDEKIDIKGEGNYEGLRLFLNDLICIQSSDNYVEIFHLSGNELKKTLIRNKLSVIEEEFPELLKTHRSFLVNVFHFQSWKTEKGKHFLVLSNNLVIPISKTNLDVVKAQLNFATA